MLNEEDNGSNNPSLIKQIQQLHNKAEGKPIEGSPSILQRNIDHIAKLVGLSETDSRLLEFAISIHNEQALDDTADLLGNLTARRAIQILSVILGIPEKRLRQSLETKSILSRSGLLVLSRTGKDCLSGRLNLLSDAFADQMTMDAADPINLLRGTVDPSPQAKLSLEDYPHIKKELDILLPFLRHAMTTGRQGVNILIYGNPGTGKSELARVLAAKLQCDLFQVASGDEDGDPFKGNKRLRALGAGQHFFAKRTSLMAFDEIEDVFNDGNLLSPSTASTHKAWINQTLEVNPLPLIWLSNRIEGMDPAFVRRFDMVFELPIPPREQRKKVVHHYAGDLLDEAHVNRLVEAQSLAPAVIERSASVIHAIKDELGKANAMSALTHLVSGTLEAQGHGRINQHDVNRLPASYDPTFIHADTDLANLVSGIRQAGAARLCLYGPPGTGKTAYGRWLAQELDRPLLVKRGSDLLSMWVGGTEKGIASAFREAERDDAILLIDEIDGFLQDRRHSQRNWETSQVNEMLTQMEAFSGVFIASTNLMDNLDQAALRRFDLKIHFGYLAPSQARQLLSKLCSQLGLPTPNSKDHARLDLLGQLTPGDFATVMRRTRFHPITSTRDMIDALVAECQLKEDKVRTIGFM